MMTKKDEELMMFNWVKTIYNLNFQFTQARTTVVLDTGKISLSKLTNSKNMFTAYSEVSNKHGVFLILFEKKFPTTCLIRVSTFIHFW